MARRHARCIAALLCFAALPVRVAAQHADRNVLETITDGVKSVVSKESGPLLSTAAAFTLVALPFDETLTYSASCSTFLKTTFDGWARVAGQEWVLASGALATYLIARATDHPKLSAVGGDLMRAQVMAGTTAFVLKHAIRRPRPDGESRAFPSGHAAGTFAAATVVQRHYGLKGAIPAYTLAVLISGARLQANSHYATDLIAGATVGILAGRAATFDLGGRRVLLAPAVTESGGLLLSGSIR
jgi:membrane-associated phospholipid phosphatase